MGLIQDLIKKAMNKEEEPEEEIPDEMTRDNYLRSLRRENRVMNEAEEKEYLIKKLAARKKELLRKNMFGLKEKHKIKQQGETSFYGKHNL